MEDCQWGGLDNDHRAVVLATAWSGPSIAGAAALSVSLADRQVERCGVLLVDRQVERCGVLLVDREVERCGVLLADRQVERCGVLLEVDV